MTEQIGLDIGRLCITLFGWYLAYSIRRPLEFRFKLGVTYSIPFVISILNYFDLIFKEHIPMINVGFVCLITMLYWREMKGLTTSEGYHKSVVSEYMNKVPDLIWMKDKHRNFTFVNQSLRDLMGIKDINPFGKSMEDISSKSTSFTRVCRSSDDIVYKTRKTGKFVECGMVNGEFRSYQVYKIPLFKTDSKGNSKFIGIMGMARDLTYDYNDHKEIGKLWCDGKMDEAFEMFQDHSHKYMSEEEIIKCQKERKDEETTD